METKKLIYPTKKKLHTLFRINKSGGNSHELGSGFLPKGSRMPDKGTSAHPRHEVTIILEGSILTTSGGKEIVLNPGDIVSIPEGQNQCTEVLEDTRLVYVFFDV